ncbi:MAG: acetate--CoA ligase family protein [Candidatus Aenigmarchaeota archaeon]|nr:acetate--CoA ligase family protein [Candidatus Aenigmarchaeota archaeon]
MKVLAEREAEDFLRKYVPVAKSALLKKSAKFWKPPFVLKLSSVKALHKSDIGGVKIVRHAGEAQGAYDSLVAITKKKKLKSYGIMMQEYVEGVEMIIGVKRDPSFGAVLMVGAGGTLVEMIKDVSFRVCPISNEDAQQMLDELKTKKLLYGFRGRAKANVAALKKMMVKISQLAIKHKIEELDINPAMVNVKSAKVVDARIVME